MKENKPDVGMATEIETLFGVAQDRFESFCY
jgi:hypothetical protein